MVINEEDYIKATHNSYGDDPTEWNGRNPSCKLCDKDIEMNDEYCEDHQRCYYCGEREECDCDERSDCCGAKFHNMDVLICSDCKEHSSNYYIDNKIKR